MALYRRVMRPSRPDALSGIAENRAIVGLSAGILSLLIAGLMDTPVFHADRLPSTLCLMLLLAVFFVFAKERFEPSNDQKPPLLASL